MSEHSVAEAESRLSALIDRALQGEQVVITRDGMPVVALRPVAQPHSPRVTAGWLRANRVKGLMDPGEDAASLVRRLRDQEPGA